MVGVAPASAQFLSILPRADEKADCAKILSEYELSGKIPTIADVKQQEFQQATNNYNAVYEKYHDTATDIECAQDKSQQLNPQKCEQYQKDQQNIQNAANEVNNAKAEAEKNANNTTQVRDNLLGCAIKTGRISLQMVPYFVTSIANFVLSLIGLLCVLFIVIGGYQYIMGGLTDQKEKGKNTIKHALMGMSIAILSWVIVTAVMNAITG